MEVIKKLSKELPFIKKIESLKVKLDNLRPLSKNIEDRVLQKLRLDWNYNSNAIEGNTFTFGETTALIMEGITAKGKPLKDALDIKGHNEAIDFMLDMIYDERTLNEADIRSLHKLVLGDNFKKSAKTLDGKPTTKLIKSGQYKTEPNHVETSTGEIHYYATPEDTPVKMQELISWYNKVEELKGFNPLVLAAIFHHKFVEIHPFDDGNGRMTRILTNFILMKYGYPVSVIKQENKNEYYSALSQADNGEIIPIIEFISDTVKHSIGIYFKAINGDDINEPDDLDKEIALFRKEFGVKSVIKKRKKDVSCEEIVFELFAPLKLKLDNFTDLFSSYSAFLLDDNFKLALNLNDDSFHSLDNFKIKSEGIIPSLKAIIFLNNFNYEIDNKTKTFEIRIQLILKENNYLIKDGKRTLIKYYDDKIVDSQVFELWREIVKDLMQQVKEIK